MKHHTLDGVTLTATGWAERAGISKQALSRKLVKVARGEKTLREALTEGNHQGRRTDIAGQTSD